MNLDELIRKLLELRSHHKETMYDETPDIFICDPDNSDYDRRIKNIKYDAGTVIIELESEEWRKY